MVLNCRLIKLVELEQVMERARSRRSARDASQRQLYNSITLRFIPLVLYLDVRSGYKTDSEVERICIRFMDLECSKSPLQQSRFRLVTYNVTKHAIRVRRISLYGLVLETQSHQNNRVENHYGARAVVTQERGRAETN